MKRKSTLYIENNHVVIWKLFYDSLVRIIFFFYSCLILRLVCQLLYLTGLLYIWQVMLLAIWTSGILLAVPMAIAQRVELVTDAETGVVIPKCNPVSIKLIFYKSLLMMHAWLFVTVWMVIIYVRSLHNLIIGECMG